MRSLAPSAAIAAAAAVVLAALATRVGDWAVMTDELLYQRLAISIGETGLPRLRGEFVDVYALLYPFVLSPVFAIVDMPDAVVVAHGWNAILFASSAIPSYLLARTLGLSPAARLLAGVFAVVIPWTVIASFLMTESAAYPASLWAAYLIQRAAVRPRDGTYALALGGIALAILARPQLIVLAVALVAAALTVELRERRGWAVHRVLVGAVAFTLLVFVLLAATGSLGSALGSYAPTIEEGALLSRGALRSSIVHLDVVAVAIGLVPLLLGGGWALEALVHRPPRIELHAFAALVVTTVGLLSLQVGSFVERFALGIDVKDRYLFYVAPLLFIATAAALEDLVRAWSARLRSPPGSCSRSGGSSSSRCSASTSTRRQLRRTSGSRACSATLRRGSPWPAVSSPSRWCSRSVPCRARRSRTPSSASSRSSACSKPRTRGTDCSRARARARVRSSTHRRTRSRGWMPTRPATRSSGCCRTRSGRSGTRARSPGGTSSSGTRASSAAS